MSRILPCPFCGKTPVDASSPDETPDKYAVQCWNCDAEGPLAEAELRAISKWNLRYDNILRCER